MLQDLQHATRTLRRRPLNSTLAALTLAVGIGAATSIFSIVNAVVLEPLPFTDPSRLVRIHAITPAGDRFSFSDADYLELRAAAPSLTSAAAFRELGSSRVLATANGPVRITAVPMSASMAGVLGVQPVRGRLFTEDEDRPRAQPRILLAHQTWLSHFGGDAAAIGRSVLVDGEPAVITGVMPPSFDFPGGVDAWVPLAADASRSRDDRELAVIARLAPGADLPRLRSDLRLFAQRLAERHPAHEGWSAGALSFEDWLVAPRVRQAIWMLLGAVTLLLLLSCVNVANLLLAQASTRQGELRIRAALGAGRGRIVRQLLAESALLAAAGTGAGVLGAAWVVEAARVLGDGRIPRVELVQIDALAIAFACLLGIASCVAAGMAPALRSARAALQHRLDEGLRYTQANRRLRHALVAVEVGLALLLLIGASLLASSFLRLVRVDDGFDTRDAVAMPVDLPSRYGDHRAAAFYSELLDRVRALPAVSAAGATSTNPFRQFGFSNTVTPEERAHEAPPSGLLQAGWRSVTPGFFEALRIPLIAGRTFTTQDRDTSERVVVVSRSLADRLWPGETAVGRRIYWGGTTGRTRTVVGVVGDIRDMQLDAVPSPMLFVPHAQVDLPAMTIVARTSLGLDAVAPALRELVRRMDPSLPPPDVHAVSASRAAAAGGHRFTLWLFGAFAAVALMLAVTGVYGTLAFTVAERRREIAVRLALGATPRRIVRLVLGSGMGFAAVGVAAGVACALAAATVFESLLYEVAPRDPASFAGAGALLLVTAGAACYLPARRAAAVDPAAALRSEGP